MSAFRFFSCHGSVQSSRPHLPGTAFVVPILWFRARGGANDDHLRRKECWMSVSSSQAPSRKIFVDAALVSEYLKGGFHRKKLINTTWLDYGLDGHGAAGILADLLHIDMHDCMGLDNLERHGVLTNALPILSMVIDARTRRR
ncbi:hypothetical protein I7I51_02776 [Histoplasma capsulatum]|uniref:Uncharacterized protein n=1 Tax=Ajellomyces capsulatus TaxID=5037 RepID=A0A8A1MRA0_AJECA|nr:hypothetical protein I7I51_02776 [Histoplasma capsulatum]